MDSRLRVAVTPKGVKEIRGLACRRNIRPRGLPRLHGRRQNDAPGIEQAAADPGAQLLPHIAIAEARFHLTNFCVDVFGARSQSFVDALGICKSVIQFDHCAREILLATTRQFPAFLPRLGKVIDEINQRAI